MNMDVFQNKNTIYDCSQVCVVAKHCLLIMTVLIFYESVTKITDLL